MYQKGVPIIDWMLYRRRRRSGSPSGFFRISGRNRSIYGSGDGEFIRLHDEFGNEWRGTGERQSDDTVRYRFVSSEGHVIAGISTGDHGVILRDEHGNAWRGFVD
jgi:hypothetical protein